MTERELFRSALFTITEFECPPADAAWTSTNFIVSKAPIVVFPRHPVGIRPACGRRVLATPNHVMLYNPAMEYERELRDEHGDACVYVTLHEPAVAALETTTRLLADGRMTTTHVPSSRGTYFRQHLLARRLRAGDADPLAVEETTFDLVSGVLSQAPAPSGRRLHTSASHHELAEAAKERIVERLAEPLTLEDLARDLKVSPFHLARVFHAQTGFSLHQYRKQLRLRFALERLPEEPSSLASLAFELGFASHSHFTDAFRREFGVAPSVVRASGPQLLSHRTA